MRVHSCQWECQFWIFCGRCQRVCGLLVLWIDCISCHKLKLAHFVTITLTVHLFLCVCQNKSTKTETKTSAVTKSTRSYRSETRTHSLSRSHQPATTRKTPRKIASTISIDITVDVPVAILSQVPARPTEITFQEEYFPTVRTLFLTKDFSKSRTKWSQHARRPSRKRPRPGHKPAKAPNPLLLQPRPSHLRRIETPVQRAGNPRVEEKTCGPRRKSGL